MTPARDALDFLVREEESHGIGDGPNVISRPWLNGASGQLVLELPLNLFGFLPRARTGLAAVLDAVLSPAEMLPAIATAGKLVTGILALFLVTYKDGNNWVRPWCLLCAELLDNGSTDLARIVKLNL